MTSFRVFIAAGMLAFSFTTANAATITVSVFDASTYNPSFATGNNIGEDFEQLGAELGEGEVGDNFATAVGTFSSLGGVGTGSTVRGLAGNTGKELALRDGIVFGRNNTTPNVGSWFLDSNDTWGMDWTVGLSGGKAFSSLMFTLSDGSDVGAFLRIVANGITFEQRVGGKLPDGNQSLVFIDFGGAVTSANILIGNYRASGSDEFVKNDGFSLDGIQVSAVPLPASLLLFGSALAGLGIFGRRRRVA